MEEFRKVLKLIVRIGIGVFFIVSAILKLLSLDHFELYIYSFNIFGFVWCGLVARAIIACELLVGVLLIGKVKYKWAWWLTMLMLVGFSLLLVYVILFRDDSNCHCMGDLIEMKPSLSLIKNLVAIMLLLFVRKEEDYKFRGRTIALVGAFVAAIVPPFALFPMGEVYALFSKSGDLDFSEPFFNALLSDSTMQDVRLDDQNYIVGVVSTGCPYCKTSSLKMAEIVEHNQLDPSKVFYIIWGDSASLRQYQEETKTESFRCILVSGVTAIRICNGHFPTYLFMKDGEVEKTADLHHLTEKSVCDHLR